MTTHQHTGAAASTGEVADARAAGSLRLWLRLDAAASGLTGVGAVAGVGFLPDLLGTPPALLWPVGGFLVVWAAALAHLASRPHMSRAAVWAVIVLNLLWVLDSVAVVLAGWFPLTGLGVGYVLLQAAAVAVFAEFQYLGARRLR